MRAYLYCDKRSLNDATNYYVGIIKECVCEKGFSFEEVNELNDISDPNLIMTLTSKYFFYAKLRYPKCKTIYWAQGVSAEEEKMNLRGFKSYLRYLFRRYTEPIAIKKSDLLFCVSDRMVQYYKETYGYKNSGNCIVMPCYNLHLSDRFNVAQYENPTFVYAGNASKWQGVDFMLDVYFLVEQQLENAKLVICTGHKEVFLKKIKQRGISNYEIKYVPVHELQDELHKYKYGLIIREDNIVNNVATPTKMNSYLANYLIPIFSDAVDDFTRNIELKEFTVMAKCPLVAEKVAQQIIDFEKTPKNYDTYESVVNEIFMNHYNDDKYKSSIAQKVELLICH